VTVAATECPDDSCKGEYSKIGKHWYHNPSHRPTITQHQHEIITGVVMGDGSVSRQSENPSLDVQMINEQYLNHLDETFGCLTTGVRLQSTAQELASDPGTGDFAEYTDPSSYSDLYRLRTRNHPGLEWYASWYSSGEKVWPTDIDLTPTTLKHWYVCDGTFDERDYANSSTIRISVANEMEYQEKVNALFETVGLPEPEWYPTKTESGREFCHISWNNQESRELFAYMGEPLPGFEYKWPCDYRGLGDC
jgi:hypothetical protein